MTSTVADTCPSCANVVVAGDLFCETCGRPLPTGPATSPPTHCPACAEEVVADDGYCGVCGMRAPVPGDHVEVAFASAAGVSDKGRRPQNQDAFALWAEPDGRVMAVVCDGVSTTARPREAARRAADAALVALRDGSGGDSPGRALDGAYAAATEAVRGLEWTVSGDSAGPPSCTLLAALAVVDRVGLTSVGDCRAFWLPDDGEPCTLTEDDSWAAERVSAGDMTPEEAYADPRSHGITRWVGDDADPSWEPRRVEFSVPGPGRLILCSDGLWNYAATASEVAAAAGGGDPLSVGRRLVDFANGKGGRDNITVVVVDLPQAAGDGGRRLPTGGTP
ncbi:MAG: protein phosphatase 2C domain-containing protein [Actinomycetota bacterium]|nr:protein phosphatase 2C domain-containing protein [Actinomycetota bacterium]